jgi:heme-degrading monooxygenase HmoA
MIVHLSIHTAKPQYEQELVASMHRFGAAAAGSPGLLSAQTLKDERSGKLVGLMRWEDRAAWQAGVERSRVAVEDDPLDLWEAEEPTGFLLTEV